MLNLFVDYSYLLLFYMILPTSFIHSRPIVKEIDVIIYYVTIICENIVILIIYSKNGQKEKENV